jgi:hypothetical protein
VINLIAEIAIGCDGQARSGHWSGHCRSQLLNTLSELVHHCPESLQKLDHLLFGLVFWSLYEFLYGRASEIRHASRSLRIACPQDLSELFTRDSEVHEFVAAF